MENWQTTVANEYCFLERWEIDNTGKCVVREPISCPSPTGGEVYNTIPDINKNNPDNEALTLDQVKSLRLCDDGRLVILIDVGCETEYYPE